MKNNYPKSRTDEIVVQELNGEVLVYDLRENRAMALNETSSAVWKACDGSNSVEDIMKAVGNEDIVWLALAELKNEKLIDAVPERPAKFEGMSRREVLGKIAVGSMLALPVIASLAAPVSAQVTGSCGGTCSNPSQCPNQVCNSCVNNRCVA